MIAKGVESKKKLTAKGAKDTKKTHDARRGFGRDKRDKKGETVRLMDKHS